MQTSSSEDSGFYDVTGSKPRAITKAEALGDDDGAAAVDEATEHDPAEETDTAAETDGSDEDKGVEDTAEVDGDVPPAAATDETDEPEVETQPDEDDDDDDTNDKGLYGASVEDAAKRIAAARGLEVMGQRVRRELHTQLDDHEAAERGREVAELIGERDRVEAAKKAANSRYNAQIKDLDERISTLAEPIREGADNVLVDCALLGDFACNTVHVVRLDTGEDVETRAMTGAERDKLAQRPLPFGGGSPRSEAASTDVPAGDDEAAAVDDAAPEDEPPLLEQGYHLASVHAAPVEVPNATGLVTAGCAEHAELVGAHHMGGQRYAVYSLDGHRHAFLPWPVSEGAAEALSEGPEPDAGADHETEEQERARLVARLQRAEGDGWTISGDPETATLDELRQWVGEVEEDEERGELIERLEAVGVSVDGKTTDELRAIAAELDAEASEMTTGEVAAEPETPPTNGRRLKVREGWRGTDPALVEKARTNLTGVTTGEAAK